MQTYSAFLSFDELRTKNLEPVEGFLFYLVLAYNYMVYFVII